MDGPFYALKRANPYFQAQWNQDRQLGPTFEDRIAELELLRAKIPSMESGQQELWAQRLEKIVQEDKSPEMRARSVMAMALLPSEAAERALNSASADDVEKVRIMTCKAWKLRGGPAARDMLLSLAQADESPSVRQAAIDGLSVFDEAEVRSTLTTLLDDRSPAIQYQAAQSLKSMTGRDYGGDFDSWKRYMAGQDVPEPEPKSMTATVLDSLPSWW